MENILAGAYQISEPKSEDYFRSEAEFQNVHTREENKSCQCSRKFLEFPQLHIYQPCKGKKISARVKNYLSFFIFS